jgi:hypothetical protein
MAVSERWYLLKMAQTAGRRVFDPAHFGLELNAEGHKGKSDSKRLFLES